MGYEQRDQSGSLFANDKKTQENHPGWKGAARIDGVDYWVSGWVKKTKTGDKWISLAFEPKNERQSGHQPIDDEDIPF